MTDTSSFSSLKYGGHSQTVRYSGAFASGWLLEGAFARAVNHIAETPSVDAWRVTDQTVSPTVTTGGIGFYEAGNRSLNRQYSVKATNVLSHHDLRYGFEYDDVDLQPDQSAHRSDVRRAGRPADRDRRRRSRSCRTPTSGRSTA